ncbi:MAG: hypothetical protein EPO42_10705 [Gallionellaceae bacterium]|nr:MAG: hypothetical protein EPO42_10705 [Gallionellaceae bacterium]
MKLISLFVCLLVLLASPLVSASDESQSTINHPPVSMSLVSTNEEMELQSLENSSWALLEQKAAGSSCETRCGNDPNSGQRICRTVCDDNSPSSSPTMGSCNGSQGCMVARALILGCFGGALIGSFSGATPLGCGVGVVLVYALEASRD